MLRQRRRFGASSSLRLLILAFLLGSLSLFGQFRPNPGGGGGTGCIPSGAIGLLQASNGAGACQATLATDNGTSLTYTGTGGIVASGFTSGGSAPPKPSGGSGGAYAFAEGTPPTNYPAVGADLIYGDSATHLLLSSFNNGSLLPLVQGPVSVTANHLATWGAEGLLLDGGILAANLVNATSPGVGLAHFAGSTQTVTSSAVVSADLNITTTSCTAPKIVTAVSATGVGTCTAPDIPQTAHSAAYTTVLGDDGTQLLHPASDNNARTFTIDSNANVAYPIGATLVFVNSINTLTIAITSDTLTLAGTSTTGSRTLAVNGIATATKVGTTSWLIGGLGLT